MFLAPQISIVVPVFDEEPSLAILHAEIARSLNASGRSWELIFVDDGSRDHSLAVMLALRQQDEHVCVLQLRHRCGQTAGMQAGFDHARGRIVVTLDGDLQNDPADIPALVDKLEEGFDLVAGWRKQRYDGFVLRRLPSVIANRLIATVTGVAIHDTGCTLKAFRRELLERMPIYAEQHRFLPAISAASGARITELIVNHRPRLYGQSKYGLGRATRVLIDLAGIKMLGSFSQRPLYFFALGTLPFFALVALFIGTAQNGVDGPGPVAVFGLMLMVMTIVFYLMLGLVAELAVKSSGMHTAGRSRFLGRVHERVHESELHGPRHPSR